MVNTHSWVMGTFIYWLQKLLNIRHQEMQVAIRNVNMVIKLIFKKFLTQFSFLFSDDRVNWFLYFNNFKCEIDSRNYWNGFNLLEIYLKSVVVYTSPYKGSEPNRLRGSSTINTVIFLCVCLISFMLKMYLYNFRRWTYKRNVHFNVQIKKKINYILNASIMRVRDDLR